MSDSLPTRFAYSDDGGLPTLEATIEHFKTFATQAATRPQGAVVVYVARVRDTPSGATARVFQHGTTRGAEDYLGALLSALHNCREAGFVSDAELRQFARRVRDVSNGRAS